MCRNTFIIPNPSRLLWSLSPTITPPVWLWLLCNALCFFTVAVGKIPLVYFFVHHIQRFGSSELLKVTTPYTSYMPYPLECLASLFLKSTTFTTQRLRCIIESRRLSNKKYVAIKSWRSWWLFLYSFYDLNISYS